MNVSWLLGFALAFSCVPALAGPDGPRAPSLVLEHLRSLGDGVATADNTFLRPTRPASMVLAPSVQAMRVADPGRDPAHAAAIDWLRENAVPLDTVKAENGFGDMQPLKTVVGDAQIVALGEATHGTREFFQLKHRMLEFLVTELGFNVFAIEANWPEALAVNDYVLDGKGDPADALAGMYFWTWNTEEVLEMIRWMRRYNQNPAHGRKVKFYGVDMQFPHIAVRGVLEYLKKVDPEYAAAVEPALAPLDSMEKAQNYGSQLAQVKAATSAGIKEILTRFDEMREFYAQRSSARAWSLARQNVVIVMQAETELRDAGASARAGNRDRSMAQNTQWILQSEGPGTKIVLWAHNMHVRASRYQGADYSMGAHLRRMFGSDFVIFRLGFNQGSFRAWTEATGLRQFTVGPAPRGSLDAALAAVDAPLFAVDLRNAPNAGPAGEWFRSSHLSWEIGAVFDSARTDQSLLPTFAARDYDAVLFVESTHAAIGNPTGPGNRRREPSSNLVQ